MEKFVSYISSRFNLKSTYYFNSYFNSINNSNLAEIKSSSLQINLIHQFAFNFPLKIKNVFNFITISQISEFSDQNIVNFFSIKNDVTYGFYKNTLVLNRSSEYFKPNFELPNSTVFLNFSLKYAPSKSKLSYYIMGENLLNERFNESTFLQDYAVSNYRVALLNRIILAGVHVHF